MDLPLTLAIRVAAAGWMASAVKAGYALRKEEMACSNSASLASTQAEITSPKIKKGKDYDIFFYFFFWHTQTLILTSPGVNALQHSGAGTPLLLKTRVLPEA